MFENSALCIYLGGYTYHITIHIEWFEKLELFSIYFEIIHTIYDFF